MTFAEALSFLETTTLDIQQAPGAFLPIHPVYNGYADASYIHGVAFAPIFLYSKEGTFTQFMEVEKINNMADRIYEKHAADPSSVAKLMSAHVAAEKKLDGIWQEFCAAQQQGHLTKECLVELYDRFFAVADEWWQYASIGEDKGAILYRRIVSTFAERHSMDIKEAEQAVTVLAHPDETSLLTEAQVTFLQMCVDSMEGKDIAGAVRRYQEKYFWLKTNFYDATVITEDAVRDEIQEKIRVEGEITIRKELENMRTTLAQMQTDKKNLSSQYSLTEEDRKDFQFASAMIRWLDIRKEGMMHYFYYTHFLIVEMGNHCGISYDEASSLTPRELRDVVAGVLAHPAELVAERRRGFMMAYYGGSKTDSYLAHEGAALLRAAFHGSGKVKEIKGMLASTGGKETLRGKIQIVFDPWKETFTPGNILVTTMTRVEFLPLMKHAAGIITDEGGIACHAAIVSRELGIPCIIGTKHGTRQLQTGDEVVMNLKTGTIEII